MQKRYCRIVKNTLSGEDVERVYTSLHHEVQKLYDILLKLVPQHRPYDILTSNACPGVSAGEKVVHKSFNK